MRFSEKFKLRHKLLLLVTVPLLLVLIYAAVFSAGRFNDLDSARDMMHLARTTEFLGAVHRLQFERSKAIDYVTEKSTENLADWRKATESTDRFVQQLSVLKKELLAENADPVVLETLAGLQKQMEFLSDIRAQVSRQQLKTREEIQQDYNELVEKIHASVSNLLNLAPGGQIFQLTDALTAVAELKETLGRMRGLVTAILNHGQATEVEIRQLVTMTTKDDLLSKKFLKLAPVRFQEEYLRLEYSEAGSIKAGIERTIIQSDVLSPITGNANQWFALATQRINGLRDLEKSINSDLLTYAEKSRERAFNSLLITLVISLGAVIIIIIVAVVATGRLADAFVKLRNSAVDFAESGELKNVAIDSQDELGDVASAFNRLIDQLRHISQAAEAVASGDFSQQLEVKSERDRLALSMNHMIKTLRESVEAMQTENWLKTGQSDLAAQINNDQNVQELAQKAINYLADYVKAPLAAIYLVDKEETAELCASYAYTFRKEARNRFKKGESLVGQAVRERKTIVIDKLPPDYVSVSSGLGSAVPQNLVVIPLLYANRVLGVLELGSLRTLVAAEMDLLRKSGENLAVALHAALSRERLADLLEETQAQAEELQAQQEELEQANSELEEQTQQLEESQQELRTQKQQLTEANEELLQKTAELSGRNRDIEARSKDLEKARGELEVKAEALDIASRYKSEFLANMSHELRSPLNSLLLLAQTLEENDEGNLTDGQKEAASIIHGSGRDLLNLINDILDLSKVEAGKLLIERETFSLVESTTLLQRQYMPLAVEKNLELAVEIAQSAPPTIHTDPQRLQQILRNLLSNAIKFTEAGRVVLRVKPDAQGGLLFQVQDTGIGIPQKLQKAIFEAFQQGDGSTRRKYSGTGLGLTISRELAHLLGGDIELQSEENQGSVFTLHLPESALSGDLSVIKEQPITNPADSIGVDKMPTLIGKTQIGTTTSVDTTKDIAEFLPDDRHGLQPDKDLLLIIEDDLVFARCLMELAHSRNFQCLVAGDGQSGVQMARRYKPDAVVLDMVLPDGGGDQVMQDLKASEHTSTIPIHIISSLDKEDLEKGDAIGVLTKPISKESIDSAFTNILRHLRSDERRCVLVIEDDRNTRKAIESLLSKRGEVEILHAGTGAEGLRLLEQEPVACVILDLHLPDMDSLDILRKIAGEGVAAPLPVIIYTGADLSHEEYKQLRQYTNNIIIKGSLAQERLLNDVTLFLHSMTSRRNRKRDLSLVIDDEILKGKKILIVDDDMRNTYALGNLLRRQGINVVMADNGSLALEKLNENKDIAIAIMDIMMPVMDGYETIRRIRERADYQDLPIIALTAKAMPEDRDKCMQVGANDYLAKPVDSERLMSALRLWASA